MHRRALFVVLPSLLAFTGAVATSVFAQAPAAEATPFAPASPPPPRPNDAGLFPAPGTAARPAPPPVPDSGELRRPNAAASGRAARRAAAGRKRTGVEGRRAVGDPTLAQAAADPVEIRIAYRRAETEAKRDPKFNELLRQAELAHDDEERRALLRQYYTALFARVRRLNPSRALAAHVAVLSRAAEQRYAPRRRVGGLDEQEAGRDRGGRR